MVGSAGAPTKSLPWILGLSLFACAESFTKSDGEGTGGANNTSGGDTSARGGSSGMGGNADAGRGGSMGGSSGATTGGKPSGGAGTGGKASGGSANGGAKSGGGTSSGGARPTGGSTNGGASTGGSSTGGSSTGGASTGGSSTGGNSSAGAGGSPDAGAGGMAPEIPTDGLVLWLRADHGVTLDGDAVTRWADQSGNGYDATPGSAEERPKLVDKGISDLPSLEFDGKDDVMNLPAGFEDFSQGVSMFTVRQATSVGAYWAVMELSNGSELDDISFGQDVGASQYEVFADTFKAGDVAVDQPQMVSTVHRTSGSADMRINLTLAGSMSVTLPVVVERAQNYVGRSLYGSSVTFPGMIAEIILYRRAVTSAERTAIEAYLLEHWACCKD